jgi:tetratricopeptide (TPR) repeat protein
MEPPAAEARLELEEITALARRFIDAKRFDEAIQLYEMALRFDPRNMGIQLSLAQAKRLRRHPRGGSPRSLKETIREQLRRDALDAKHFLGLSYLFADRGDEDRAREYLEIAIAKDLPNPPSTAAWRCCSRAPATSWATCPARSRPSSTPSC